MAPPLIHARLTVNYPGFALDVDLDLPGSGVTALFGPSGCGKTTILRAIAGLTRAQPGFVCVNDQVWQDDTQHLWQPTHERGLGYVFQEANLFEHLSVRSNIEYGMHRATGTRKASMAKGSGSSDSTLVRVELDPIVELLGITQLMDRKPNALSGGEAQRVAIARALATSPRLLLMDEPLAALDVDRKAEVLPYLDHIHRTLNIPIIYVSHALDEVFRLASHMVVLRAGQVTMSGPVHALRSRWDLPCGMDGAAFSVIEAMVLWHESMDHITTVQFYGDTLFLVSPQPRSAGQKVHLRIQARDVNVSLAPQANTSILNTLPATVTDIQDDHRGQCLVAMDVHGTRLLAQIAQRSVLALGLRPGMNVFAHIKTMDAVG